MYHELFPRLGFSARLSLSFNIVIGLFTHLDSRSRCDTLFLSTVQSLQSITVPPRFYRLVIPNLLPDEFGFDSDWV